MVRPGLLSLSTEQCLIAPSLLAADFSALGNHMRDAEAAGADLFHVDIMDGHFVPNLSMGPPVVEAIRPISELLFDVHLMQTHPQDYIKPFHQAGANHITIHVEADCDVAQTLNDIHELGISAGISLRPGTDVEAIRPYLDQVDLILIMTVEPGFGGQSFRHDMLERIAVARQWISDAAHPIHLEVDGGIKKGTAELAREAGANILVAGTSVFRAPEGQQAAIATLRG